MSKSTRFAVVIVILAVPLILFAAGIFKFPQKSTQTPQENTQNNSTSNPTIIPEAPKSEFPILPNLTDGTNLLFLSYSLNGKLESISQAGENGTFTITDQKGTVLSPEFPITKLTQVAKFNSSASAKTEETGAVSDLVKGKTVSVSAVYDFNKKIWTVHKITIMQ